MIFSSSCMIALYFLIAVKRVYEHKELRCSKWVFKSIFGLMRMYMSLNFFILQTIKFIESDYFSFHCTQIMVHWHLTLKGRSANLLPSVCIILGIVNLFHVTLVVLFSALTIIEGVLLIFIELPFLSRICPVSDKFQAFTNAFASNYYRGVSCYSFF